MPLPIFDGHNDVLLRLMRQGEGAIEGFLEGAGQGQLDLPRARAGGFAGGFFACFVPSLRTPATTDAPAALVTPDLAQAQAAVQSMLAIAMRLEALAPDRIAICTEVRAIEAAIAAGRLAMVLHLEGAEAIDDGLDALWVYRRAGVRSLGPVWSRPNRFGTGVPFRYGVTPDQGPGLTPAGKELVRACNTLGILLDLSHLNEAGFWDVAALSSAPLVATHSCVHALCPTARNLTDHQLDAIRASRGVVGLNFSVSDLRPDGRHDPDFPLEVMARHIAHLIAKLGIDGVALGSDFDGATVPAAIRDAAGLPNLVRTLAEHGLDEASLYKITMGNWLRVLGETWSPETQR